MGVQARARFCLFLFLLSVPCFGIWECPISIAWRGFWKGLFEYQPIISATDILGEGFYTPEKEGVVVGIDGTAHGLPHDEHFSGKFEVDGSTVFHASAKNPANLIEQLLAIYEEAGPIAKMGLVAHGSSGNFFVGANTLQAELGIGSMLRYAKWNQSKLKALPRDLFTKDALVVLLSCHTFASPPWDRNRHRRRLLKIFSNLMKQGGRVVGTSRYCLLQKEEEKNVELTAGAIMFVLLTGFFNYLTSDTGSVSERIREVEIPSSI